MEKFYLNNLREIYEKSKSGLSIYVEYGEKFEEIEEAKKYEIDDWNFLIKSLNAVSEKKVSFFVKENIYINKDLK